MKLTEINDLLTSNDQWHQFDDSTLYHPDDIYLGIKLKDLNEGEPVSEVIRESTINLIKERANYRRMSKKMAIVEYDGRPLFQFKVVIIHIEGRDKHKGVLSEIYIPESEVDAKYKRPEISNAILSINTSELTKLVWAHLKYN